MTSVAITSDTYILGHDEQALERLIRQSDYWAADTRAFLQRAGLAPGMRVLDLGNGAGDVALLAATLVVSSGVVVSVDRAPEAMQRATQRAAQLNIANVQFMQADINAFEPEGMFDAIIRRLVLMYLPDPAAVLRQLAAHVTPGGTAVGVPRAWSRCNRRTRTRSGTPVVGQCCICTRGTVPADQRGCIGALVCTFRYQSCGRAGDADALPTQPRAARAPPAWCATRHPLPAQWRSLLSRRCCKRSGGPQPTMACIPTDAPSRATGVPLCPARFPI